MAKIKSYETIRKSDLLDNDVFLVETDNGTKTISAKDVADTYGRDDIDRLMGDVMHLVPELPNAENNHNLPIGQIYRVWSGNSDIGYTYHVKTDTFLPGDAVGNCAYYTFANAEHVYSKNEINNKLLYYMNNAPIISLDDLPITLSVANIGQVFILEDYNRLGVKTTTGYILFPSVEELESAVRSVDSKLNEYIAENSGAYILMPDRQIMDNGKLIGNQAIPTACCLSSPTTLGISTLGDASVLEYTLSSNGKYKVEINNLSGDNKCFKAAVFLNNGIITVDDDTYSSEATQSTAILKWESEITSAKHELFFDNTYGNSILLIDLGRGSTYSLNLYKIEGKPYKLSDNVLVDNTRVVSELPQTGDPDINYILNANGKLTYYKWVNNTWQIVNGDTYTKTETNTLLGAISEDIEDLSDTVDIKASQSDLNALSATVDTKASQADLDDLSDDFNHLIQTGVVQNVETIEGGIKITFNDGTQTTIPVQSSAGITDVALQIQTEEVEGVDVAYLVMLDAEDNELARVQLPALGGGGSTTTTTMSIERVTQTPIVLTVDNRLTISLNFSCTDGEGDYVDCTYVWKKDGSVIKTGSMVSGLNSFDFTEFLTTGNQKFTIVVTDETGNISTKSWNVTVADVRVVSNFNDSLGYNLGRTVSVSYTPYGAFPKIAHFVLDGVEIGTADIGIASGSELTYDIPSQLHGSHLLEIYTVATINENITLRSNSVYKDIAWVDPESNVPIISTIYRSDYYGTVNVRQYDNFQIPYSVHDLNSNNPEVTLSVDGVVVSEMTLSSVSNVWNYKVTDLGSKTLTITCGETSVDIELEVESLGIDVNPVTSNLEFDFNPYGKFNNSSNRLLLDSNNSNTTLTVSENFDWDDGGYKIDEHGHTYFLIKSGSRATFDYKMFAGNNNSNPSVFGAEMKVIFMTENVQKPDAVWLSNVETTTVGQGNDAKQINVGIQLGVHDGWFKTNNASNTDIEGEGVDSIAASNTYLYVPYSEEDIIEMDINIDTLDRSDSTAKSFVMSYEDGVPSKAYVYNSTDRFYQYNPKSIVVGSDYCDVRIYRMKVYSSSLSTENIMRNFIADSRDSETMLSRYNRNSIYYNKDTNTYTPYSGQGVLEPERVAPMMPNTKVLMLETDHFTTSKKTFVKSSLRCIHASGGTIFNGDPYWDNWLFEYGYHAGQGTTSDNYGTSGRNVDFLFNCDGIHKPSDKVEAEEGYISQVTLGYGTPDATTEVVTDWKGDAGKISLTRTSIPNNFFNFKVNVASSESANNALLQKRYNDFLPYISPAKKRDSRIKNDMEFVPAILFVKETNPDISTHNEFLDTNWHFYALGNLGDSKKTDYTRAYDPEDMNEFTIEISDNVRNNSTFQTGVYLDEHDQRQIENFDIVETEEDGETIYKPVSIAKPQSFVYPITLTEWENENNMRRWCLYNEDFDGDHSFEPRYACCGDYRDGKLVNDTTGRGKAQVKINNEVWRAFYRWCITATDEEFRNELDEWCVRSAVEFFYAFTHIYTMMDNRAKNTFWHFAKTGTYRRVSKPVKELLHVYHELVDGEYVPTQDSTITNGKTYYTEYAFDIMDYDNDTALGINNNGELIFPYGKEDRDYNIDGDIESGYVFNGADSVFWCRLRDLLPTEIKNAFTSVAAECFSADNLIKQFDDYQECYPEEIWRLDVTRKYIRTFKGESIDNSKPKRDVQYLRDMMQGRKKYHRRQWTRDQIFYFGSKNLIDSVVSSENSIIFRCYNPGASAAVPADYTLKITPFSDMYVSADFGAGDTRQIRAKAGQMVSLNFFVSTATDTQVKIYGADHIAELNDLSACYLTANHFEAATRLRKLVLGNSTEGYTNDRLTSLSLGNNKLLEELDICNLRNLTGSLDLSASKNLKRLYAENTALTGITFATNGKLQIAHLPDSINALIMRKLNHIEDFEASLRYLATLAIQGGNLDNVEIVSDCLDTLRELELLDLNWDLTNSESAIEFLESIYSIPISILAGRIKVDTIRESVYKKFTNKWKELEIRYNNLIEECTVTFKNFDGTVLDTQTVFRGYPVEDPVTRVNNPIAVPTKPSTNTVEYTYNGWNITLEYVNADTDAYPVYNESTRLYTLRFHNVDREGVDTVLNEFTNKEFGNTIVYDYDTLGFPERQTLNNYTTNIFKGFTCNGILYDTKDITIVDDIVPESSNVIDLYAEYEVGAIPAGTGLISTEGYDALYSNVEGETSAITLGELIAICNSGTAQDRFAVGDEIHLDLGELNPQVNGNLPFHFKIVDFNKYEIDDDTFANVILQTEGVETQTYAGGMYTNAFPSSNHGFKYLENHLGYFPMQFRAQIPTVRVRIVEPADYNPTIVYEKLFLPSILEMYSDLSEPIYNGGTDQIPVYINSYSPTLLEIPDSVGLENRCFQYYSISSNKIKKTHNGEGSASHYFSRTVRHQDDQGSTKVVPLGVKSNGYLGYFSNNDRAIRVSFCFCLGRKPIVQEEEEGE